MVATSNPSAQSVAAPPNDADELALHRAPSIWTLIRTFIADSRALFDLTARTLAATPTYLATRKGAPKGAVLQQMATVGNGSMFFMAVTMAFIGAIVTFQTGLQSQKLVPDFSLVGATFAQLLVRDFAASVGALPLATRIGAGMAAELGSMVVTDQVDALRMSGADAIRYLVVPRFLACLFAGTAVLIIAGFIAFGSGALVAWVSFDVNPRTFANLIYVRFGDVAVGLLKCFAYSGTIALVSASRGLATFGGSEGVGKATTEAVVGSCFAIIVLNLVISSAAYMLGI